MGACPSSSVDASSRYGTASRLGTDPDSKRLVAVIGMGCRYPNGVDDVAAFWRMLAEGLDCTVPNPPERFDTSYFYHPTIKMPGKFYCRGGGYLNSESIYQFDRLFFRMPPAEADHLDPQVRLLLEVTWEALEDGGLSPVSLRGSDTGVYVGVTSNEYFKFVNEPAENLNAYSNSGTNSCMVANRVSYEFDFRGPSYSIDTACSSSLYAIHQASEALRRGDCEMAVAGGVNSVILPTTTIAFCQAQMLSPDGKCKSFDARADGYARSEGAGMIVLKPLIQALKDNDPIYALIRGGALSNDGKTQGIAQPSYDAQVALVDRACRHAAIHPSQVQYIEAHGTGTKAGDRTEANAIGQAMGRSRGPHQPPLYIGSVKSNIGHTEGAAGVAGVMKATMTLAMKQIPPVVHFNTPNPDINFTALNLCVPTSLTSWPPHSGEAMVGCSSFGFGGANAHIVLQESPIARPIRGNLGLESVTQPRETVSTRDSASAKLLLLSAASADALTQHIRNWIGFLETVPSDNAPLFTDVLYSAARRSQHHSHRLAAVVHTPRDAIQCLQEYLNGTKSNNVTSGFVGESTGVSNSVVFAFSGMGTQWWAMARQLLEENDHFMSTIKRIDRLFRRCGAQWSLVDVLTSSRDTSIVNNTDIAQPSIFAVQVGVVELLRLLGIHASAVVGHSVGEVAASYAAGCLTLAQAAYVIYNRGKLLKKTSGRGGMLAVLGDYQQVEKHLTDELGASVYSTLSGIGVGTSGKSTRIDIAAVNSPSQVVLSGEDAALRSTSEDLRLQGMKTVFLRVDNAFHSFQQAPLRDSVLKALAQLAPLIDASAALPMVSSVTAGYVDSSQVATAGYWWLNVRQKVQFKDATEKLLTDGYRTFIEIGPHSPLTPAIRETAASQGLASKVTVIPTLQRPRDITAPTDDSGNMLRCLASLHTSGFYVDFGALYPDADHAFVPLPHYPWQREQCLTMSQQMRAARLFPVTAHQLLGQKQQVDSDPDMHKGSHHVWCSQYTAASVPWISDHVLQETVVAPAAAYIETGLAAGKDIGQGSGFMLTDLKFEKFLFAGDNRATTCTTAKKTQEGGYELKIYSQDDHNLWHRHAQMFLDFDEISVCPSEHLNIDDIRSRCMNSISRDAFYGQRCLEAGGFQLGVSFRIIQEGLVNEDCTEALLLAAAPDEVAKEMSCYTFHPAYMDGILQSFAVLQILHDEVVAKRLGRQRRSVVRVPFSARSFKMVDAVKPKMWIHLKANEVNGQWYCDVTVAGHDDLKTFCKVCSLKFEAIASGSQNETSSFWSLGWIVVDEQVEAKLDDRLHNDQQLLVIGFHNSSMDRLCRAHEDSGATVHSLQLSNLSGFQTWQSDIQEALSAAVTAQVARIIILVHHLDSTDSGDGLLDMRKEDFMQLEMQSLLPALFTLQHLVTLSLASPPSVWLITVCSRPVLKGDPVDVLSVPAMAFVVTTCREQRDVMVYSVDIGHEGYDHFAHYLSNALTTENEIALRASPDGTRYDVYACRVWDDIDESTLQGTSVTSDWMLQRSPRGEFRFILRREKEASATNKHVTVRVTSFALKKYSQVGESVPGWVSGHVVSCSDSVTHLQAGDEVIGFVAEVGSLVTISADDLVRKPSSLSHEESTILVRDMSLPFMMLTSGVDLKAGEVILVYVDQSSHGLSVCQVALNLGAKVVAIPATPAIAIQPNHPDSFLSVHLSDLFSLSDQMEKYFRVKTADVVFIGLASDRIATDLICHLKPFGTIVDYETGRLVRQKDDTPYRSLVIKPSVTCSDGRIQKQLLKSLKDLIQLACEGTNGWKPSNIQAVSVAHIHHDPQLAAILMNDSGLSATPVISCNEDVRFTIPADVNSFRLEPDETYLITGGLKGFGLSVSEWLAERGARNLIMVGRSPPGAEAVAVIDQLVARGINIYTYQVDVSNAESVNSLMNQVTEKLPPLAGVFHCATVYSDAWLSSIAVNLIREALEAKSYGALLLHQQTVKRQLKIKLFVLFSSMVSFLGNAGQIGYCAANIFLNALADYRHQMGLPATAVQYGPIGDSGYLARNPRILELWQEKGFRPLAPHDALYALGRALVIKPTQVAIQAQLDKGKFLVEVRPWLKFNQSRYKSMIPMEMLTDTSDEQTSVMAMPKERRVAVVQERLTSLIEEKLGVSSPQSSSSLVSLGLDSVGATDMSLHVNGRFGVNMQPVRLLNNQCTIESLSELIVKALEEKSGAVGTDSHRNMDAKHKNQEINSKWLLTLNPQSQAKMSLICFPPNAFGASSFANWDVVCNRHGIELTVIRFPGWLGREQEQCIDNLEQLVLEATDVLLPLLSQKPFAFYGHSMGALIAYEVTHVLVEKHYPIPTHFFAGGWFAPHLPYPHPDDFNTPDSIFRQGASVSFILKHLAKFKFIEKNPRLFKERHPLAITKLQLALPCLQAGLNICKRYVSGTRRLPCPVTVFSGQDDEFVTGEMMEPWKLHARVNESSPMFRHVSVNGNHFFTVSKYREVTAAIAAGLQI